MACIKCDKLGLSEFYNSISAKDKTQDIRFNQRKLKVNDSLKKMKN